SNWVAYKITFKQVGYDYIIEEAYTYHRQTSNGLSWNNYHTKVIFLLVESYLLGEDLWFLANSKVDEILKIDINGLHGFNYWKSVYKNGLAIAEKHGTDKEVIKYFAFLHDIGRESEGTDIEHGKRSVKLIREIDDEIKLDEKQMTQLIEAVENHSDGSYKNDDKTIMTCLDADRLDLPRVGTEVNSRFLYFK
ncbi:MAG: HD domain-containing protein, partial [Clostridiales bacterium]|nr:HD domain-containing protein [Clostridiales bacterium]